ncbi:hypothetical protein WMF38_57725 [Sorangium sp. So ce118]
MPRRSPDLERLERENALLRRILGERSRDPGDMPGSGCGDNSCEVRTPSGGMATNGGCCCDEREVRRALRFYKRLALFRQETVREAREEAERLRGEVARLQAEREEA